MSDSLQHYGLYPTRLLCPWDSADKNTGVGCHALFQEIFPTQGLSLCLSCLLHGQEGSSPLTRSLSCVSVLLSSVSVLMGHFEETEKPLLTLWSFSQMASPLAVLHLLSTILRITSVMFQNIKLVVLLFSFPNSFFSLLDKYIHTCIHTKGSFYGLDKVIIWPLPVFQALAPV